MLHSTEISSKNSYIQLESNDVLEDNNISTQLFYILDKAVMFMPMWSSKSIINSNLEHKRSTILNNMMNTINIIIALTHCVFVCYDIVTNLYENDLIFKLMYLLKQFNLLMSRLCCIFYFHNEFHYPWYSHDKSSLSKHFNHPLTKKNTFKVYMIIMYIQICLTFILDAFSRYGAMQKQLTTIPERISVIMARVFIYWPIFVTFCVHSAICVWYYCYIKQLISQLENNAVCMKDLFSKYKLLYAEFKKDQSGSISYCIKFSLLNFIIEMWISSYKIFSKNDIQMYHILYLIQIFFIIFIYVRNSSLLCETFDRFEELLWSHGPMCLEMESDANSKDFDKNYYNYFLQYVGKYSVNISWGKLTTVTRINFFKFLLAFIIARFAAYATKVLYS
eukprot:298687_1